MCRIHNRDRCLKEFEIDYRQRKYIKSLTFIFKLFVTQIQEPTRSTYYKFYKVNAALRSAVVIFYSLQMNRVLLQRLVSVTLSVAKYF